jgi:hypothetical protein
LLSREIPDRMVHGSALQNVHTQLPEGVAKVADKAKEAAAKQGEFELIEKPVENQEPMKPSTGYFGGLFSYVRAAVTDDANNDAPKVEKQKATALEMQGMQLKHYETAQLNNKLQETERALQTSKEQLENTSSYLVNSVVMDTRAGMRAEVAKHPLMDKKPTFSYLEDAAIKDRESKAGLHRDLKKYASSPSEPTHHFEMLEAKTTLSNEVNLKRAQTQRTLISYSNQHITLQTTLRDDKDLSTENLVNGFVSERFNMRRPK